MLGALLLDTLTGSILAFRQNKFETRRAAIGLIKLVSYSIMLAMAFQLGKHERTFFWLPETVAFSLILLTVTSVAKNGSLLGILPPMLSRQLLRYVDNYKEQPIKTTPPAAPHA
jgi:phage-related holin